MCACKCPRSFPAQTEHGSSAFRTESGRLRHHGEQKEDYQAIIQSKEGLRTEAVSKKIDSEKSRSKKEENGAEEVESKEVRSGEKGCGSETSAEKSGGNEESCR